MTFSNKIPNGKKEKKSTKKEWPDNKQYNTKKNKRISKSNSPHRKMSLNEEWYIIQWELEVEKIIYQNHIKFGSHIKVNPTLKEIKKPAYDWNNIKKDIREFYFKCPTWEIKTSKPRKNYVVKHIESNYSRQKYQADIVYLDNYISNNTNIYLRWLIIS